MSELNQLQQRFQDYLETQNPVFQQEIIGTERASSIRRLGIYADAYRFRLCDALADNYPVLFFVLGSEQFFECSMAYIQQYPSTYRNIRWFGDHLSEFLQTYSSEFPSAYLAELATFEYVLRNAFDVADLSVCVLEDMAAISPDQWGRLKFSFHPSVSRLDLKWNIASAWNACQDNTEMDPPLSSDLPVAWLIWREALDTKFVSLTVDEAWAIDALMRGLTFADLCEGLCEWIDPEHVAMRAAGFLKGWLQSGLIVGIHS
jgi:hypothetical protein